MNIWKCDVIGCKSSAVGIGGAVGLRAIGWHVVLLKNSAPHTFCPAHEELHNAELEKYVERMAENLYTDTEKYFRDHNL